MLCPHRIAAAALMLAVAAAVHLAEAQERPQSWTATVTARLLNVRAGPGEGYEIVDSLERGEKVEVHDQDGRWIRLLRDDEAWVYRAFVRLPKDFMAPLFSQAQNAFLEWAAQTGDLQEISVDGEGKLSVILAAALYEEPERIKGIAREIACAYRTRLKLDTPILVTVWSEHGPAAGWVMQARCP